MGRLSRCWQFLDRPHLRLIALVGSIVPRRLRADWRQEWEAELRGREMQLADWDRLDRRHKLDLLRRSTSAFADALWLQRRRLEGEVFQDLRYGLRMLVVHRGVTAVSIVTLALAIGANTAIFSLLDEVLIRALAVESPEQLVTFVRDDGRPAIFSYPKFTEIRDHNDALAGVLAYFQMPFSMSDGRQGERVTGQIVSGNYFAVLGVRPAIGRFFLPHEDRTPGAHPVVVIGHDLWRRRFEADPAVLGRTVTVNVHRYTIVGVAPREFTGTTKGTATDVYVPAMMLDEAIPGRGGMLKDPNSGWLTLIGRLKPNVTRDQAEGAVAALASEPGQSPGKGKEAPVNRARLMDGRKGHTNRVHDLSLPLKLMMSVVGLVLLIACANIANLLLARGSTRSREISVRLAVGASRARIVRQLVTEATMLAVLGGVAGLTIAYWLTGLLLGFHEPVRFVPRVIDASLDGRALGFTLGVSLLTGILFSLAPALRASKPDVAATLKRDTPGLGRGGRWFGLRSVLVVIQVAISLVVLIGAGLCVKSVRVLQAIDPGLEPASVLTASFDLRLNGYDEAQGLRFVSDLSRRVAALPGVEAVSFARIVAFSENVWISGATIDGYQPQPGERLGFDFNVVSPDYFRTVGAPVVSGREFTDGDTAQRPRVIVVNEAMAHRYWPGQDAVGKGTSRGEVVGVVRNSREKGLTEVPRPIIYMPLLQSYVPELTLHVRTAIDPHTLLAGVRREVHSLDPTLPVHDLRTLAEQKDGSLYTERMAAALLTLFAGLAALVAAVGIYGVLSYAVTERTREIGIRLAHGAQPPHLMRLLVGQGMFPTLVGLVLGLGAAFALTRLVQRLLFGISTTDPMTFATIPLLLAAVALLACWIPAGRAARLDPLAALRHD